MRRQYQLNNLSKRQVAKAKEFIKKEFYGYFEVCLDEKIKDAFSKMKEVSFEAEDAITISFPVVITGNVLMAAIGMAIIDEREGD